MIIGFLKGGHVVSQENSQCRRGRPLEFPLMAEGIDPIRCPWPAATQSSGFTLATRPARAEGAAVLESISNMTAATEMAVNWGPRREIVAGGAK